MTRRALPGRRARRGAVGIATLLAGLTLARSAGAHDFWLVPELFQVADDATIQVRGQTSSAFPSSVSAVETARIAEARVIGAREDARITDAATHENSLLLRHRPHGIGQRLVAVVIAPTTLRVSGPGFREYMVLEGAAALAARYEQQGLLPGADSITRRYAKYAKTFIEVGTAGPRVFDRVAGHMLEFIPLRDPESLRPGDTLTLTLRYRGAPLPDAEIHAGVAVEGGTPLETSLSTDSTGQVRVPVPRAGLWNVRTLHIVPADAGSGADWDSHFATIVFRVR